MDCRSWRLFNYFKHARTGEAYHPSEWWKICAVQHVFAVYHGASKRLLPLCDEPQRLWGPIQLQPLFYQSLPSPKRLLDLFRNSTVAILEFRYDWVQDPTTRLFAHTRRDRWSMRHRNYPSTIILVHPWRHFLEKLCSHFWLQKQHHLSWSQYQRASWNSDHPTWNPLDVDHLRLGWGPVNRRLVDFLWR